MARCDWWTVILQTNAAADDAHAHVVTDTDRVLVAGAGPVGMVTARYLAGEGIPVTVLEAEHDLPKDLRASTFHPPTLDMLDRFGASDKCIEQGLVCPHWQFRDRREGVIATFDLGLLESETRHPYRLQCEQWRLTRILREDLAQFPHAEIRYGTAAKKVRQDESKVELTIMTQAGEETLAGRYLCASDGASSAVRKSVGIEFEGLTIPEVFLTLSTDFRFEKHIEDLANIAYLSDPEEWLVLLRTRSVWRVLFPTSGETAAEMTAPTRIEARLQSVVPSDEPYEVAHTTAYRVHERVAERYVAGRVFLAGDAAHINNPLGGMGMNGGIHDAMNLAEKLTAVWHGARADILQRYERQRRKVAIETVQATALRNRRMLNATDPAERRTFHDDLRRTVGDPRRHFEYVMRSSMLQSLRDLEQVT